MAQLPDAMTFGERPTPEPSTGVATYDPSKKGAALESIGTSISKFGDDVDRINMMNQVTKAGDLENQARAKIRDMLYDPDTGILNLKGKDALGVSDQVKTHIKDMTDSMLGQIDDPRARRLLERSLGEMGNTAIETSMRHQSDQTQVWKINTANATAGNAQNDVALDPQNDALFDKNLKLGVDAQVAAAKVANKYEPGETEREASTAIIMPRVKALLASQDPNQIVKAGKIFHEAIDNGTLDWKAIGESGDMMKTVVPAAQAQVTYNKMASTPPVENVPADVFYNNGMRMAESNGQQRDKTGEPLLGPVIPGRDERAVGAGQVLPSTGKETAEKHGITWDEGLFRNDAAYNLKVGELYFNDQRQKYGSNVLAALAYNWGPDKVDKYIEKAGDPSKGEVSYDKFINGIPNPQAKAYVGKVAGFLQGPNLLPADRVADTASKLPDVTQPYFSALTEAHNQQELNQWNKGRVDAITATQTSLAANGGNIMQVPPDVRTQAIKYGVWDQLSQSRGYSAPSLKAAVDVMSTDDLLNLDLTDPKIMMGLSTKDYGELQKKQQDLVSDPAKTALGRQIDAAVKYAFQTKEGGGYSSDQLADDRSNSGKALHEQIANFKDLLSANIQAMYADKKTIPDRGAIFKMTDDILMNKTVTTQKGRFWDTTVDTTNIPVSSIPDDIRRPIEQYLIQSKQGVTDANVKRLYAMHLKNTAGSPVSTDDDGTYTKYDSQTSGGSTFKSILNFLTPPKFDPNNPPPF